MDYPSACEVGHVAAEQMEQVATACRRYSPEMGARHQSASLRRATVVAGAGMVLIFAAVSVWRGAGESSVLHSGSAMLSAVSTSTGTARREDPQGELKGKALVAVQRMFAKDPKFVEEFASLTGRGGQALLHELRGPGKQQNLKSVPPAPHPDAKLNKDMQNLKTVLASSGGSEGQPAEAEGQEEQAVEDDVSSEVGAGEPLALTKEEEAERARRAREFGTADVNQRSAWMMVQGLSSDWDTHSNYTSTPWEFCTGRHLSPRQIRVCAGHLIHAAGVTAHRDLNLNAQIYDRFCTGDEHQWLGPRGSPHALPAGANKMCLKAVTAKDNVERLLKRQISQYKTHRDPVTGTETPPKMEVQGSHSVNCEELPEGCR